MAIRLPLTTLLDVNNSTVNATGPASTAGGVANAFLIPQDCDNIVVKFTASVMAGGASAVLQTSDDGGATWYDVARTSIVSNANATNAQWLSTPVIGIGVRTGVVIPSVVATGSVQSFGSVYGAIGQSPASGLGQLEVSGLPILGRNARIFLRYTAAVTSIISERVTVMANSQSATS